MASLAAGGSARAASGQLRVRVADEGERVLGDARSPGGAEASAVELEALRGETVAFQIVVSAGDAPASGVEVEARLVPSGSSDAEPRLGRFVEHYVRVKERSRNTRRPRESLGWSAEARPPDDASLGLVPDALVPVELAKGFVPYPLEVPAGQSRAVWVDVEVPDEAAEGDREGEVTVRAGGAEVARLPLRLRVSPARLPYRPVSFLAYYGPYQLRERMGDEAAAEAEPQLWQLLHAHHLDALASLSSPDDARRLSSALDGSLFTPAHGYRGPGQGVAPAAAALGAYGALGDPTPEAKRVIEATEPLVPSGISDLFVYAIDEQCESPRGPGFRRLLQASPSSGRVKVAQTCSEDPSGQNVDLALVTADAFDARAADRARRSGKSVWVYNGALPRSGSLLLDAGLSSLTASAWAAATHEVGRWFLWEVAFWNDGNRGGHGPVDPFVEAETFHNRSGDAALYDGLLVYPGLQKAPFEASSLGYRGVLPSMRLKALRRGIEDAGLLSLARAARPDEADRVALDALPAALDELSTDQPARWDGTGAKFRAARARLRKIIAQGAPRPSMDDAAAAALLREGARARDRITPRPRPSVSWRPLAAASVVAAAMFVLLRLARLAARRLSGYREARRAADADRASSSAASSSAASSSGSAAR